MSPARRWTGKHEPGCPLRLKRAEYYDAHLTTRWRIAVLNDDDLTFAAKGTALVVSTWMDNRDAFACVRAKRIARDAGYSVSTFWRHVEQLKRAGFLWYESYPGHPSEFHADIPDGAFPECTCRIGATPPTHEGDTADASARDPQRTGETPVLGLDLGLELEKPLRGAAAASEALKGQTCFVCEAAAAGSYGGQWYCGKHNPSLARAES